MKIVAKSLWVKEEIQDKINRGAKNIEIQFYNDFIERINLPVQEMFDMSILDKVNISSLHTPLSSEKSYDLENIRTISVITKMAELGEYIAKIQNHLIKIVVHMSLSYKTLKDVGILDRIKTFLLNLVYNYSNIEICIENVIPFDLRNNHIHLFDNNDFGNVQLAELCNHPRIGTVLDTCHMYATQNIDKLVYNYVNGSNEHYNEYTLEDYIIKYKNTIKIIHLNNIIGNGLLKDNHGIIFNMDNENDIIKFNTFIDLYKEYKYNVDIVLEVREKGYKKAENFSIMYNLLKNSRLKVY